MRQLPLTEMVSLSRGWHPTNGARLHAPHTHALRYAICDETCHLDVFLAQHGHVRLRSASLPRCLVSETRHLANCVLPSGFSSVVVAGRILASLACIGLQRPEGFQKELSVRRRTPHSWSAGALAWGRGQERASDFWSQALSVLAPPPAYLAGVIGGSHARIES